MKNNNVIILLIIAVAVSVSIYVSRYGTPIREQNIGQLAQSREDDLFAIFVPATHPAMEQIERGILKALDNDATYIGRHILFNANGNKTLLRGQAEEIVENKNIKAIFTIGTTCSQIIAELTKKKGRTTPVIFTAIDNDPVKLGIVPSLESSGSNLTGCIIKDNFADQFDALLQIKPDVKRVLFVYDPSHGSSMDQKKKELEIALAERSIALTLVEVFQSSEVSQKVASHMQDVDVLFIYTDHTVVSAIDALITLCNRYKVTLFASDLNSAIDKGAAIAYGVEEITHGICAAHKAEKIFRDHKLPSQVPITPVTGYKIVVNTLTMKNQGLDLSKEQLDTILNNGGLLFTKEGLIRSEKVE